MAHSGTKHRAHCTRKRGALRIPSPAHTFPGLEARDLPDREHGGREAQRGRPACPLGTCPSPRNQRDLGGTLPKLGVCPPSAYTGGTVVTPGDSHITPCPLFRQWECAPWSELAWGSSVILRGSREGHTAQGGGLGGGAWISGAEEGDRATGARLAHPVAHKRARGSPLPILWEPQAQGQLATAPDRQGSSPLPAPSLSPVSTQLTHGEGPRGGSGGRREGDPRPILSLRPQRPLLRASRPACGPLLWLEIRRTRTWTWFLTTGQSSSWLAFLWTISLL